MNRKNGAVLPKEQSQIMYVARDVVDVSLPQRRINNVNQSIQEAFALTRADIHFKFNSS